jgi:hypothetical protein
MKEIILKIDIHTANHIKYALDHVPATGEERIDGVISTFLLVLDDLISEYNKEMPRFDSEYYTENEVSDMDIMGDNFREYLYGWNDAFVQGKGYLKKYVDMYLTHIH